jgi:hypothetical protein
MGHSRSSPKTYAKAGGLRFWCEGPEPFAMLVDSAPEVVAGEADVLPAEWGDVGEQFVGRGYSPLSPEVADGAVEVNGVPKDDGEGD